MSKEVILTQGRVAVVDDNWYDSVMEHSWCYDTNYKGYEYATCKVGKITVSMHRLIMGLQPGDSRIVDHINGNGLDNRAENLRVCTKSQNSAYSRSRGGSSKYKGVSRCKDGKYQAYIHKDYKKFHIGTFDTEEDAAIMFNKTAINMYGEFAKLNQIGE